MTAAAAFQPESHIMLLSPIDWGIILLYVVGCAIVGVWMKRYVRGVEDFTVAGREMDVNLGIASLAATELGLATVMYTAELGFKSGFAGAVPGVLRALAMFLVGMSGFVIVPLRKAGVITIPELFEKRFGKRVRWLAGLVVVVGGVLNMGIFLRLGGEFLVYVTGLDPDFLEWTMTILLAIVLLYTVLGGMVSVLVTDFIQFLVMGLGIVGLGHRNLQRSGDALSAAAAFAWGQADNRPVAGGVDRVVSRILWVVVRVAGSGVGLSGGHRQHLPGQRIRSAGRRPVLARRE